MHWKTLLAFAMLASAALAGCADNGEAPVDDGTGGPDPTTGTDGNGTAPLQTLTNATLRADVLNGTAPLLVNFTLDAEGSDANTTWSLDFGDGNATNGTGLPATVAHTYNQSGNMSATFQAMAGNSTVSTNLTITIVQAAAGQLPPETTHWEFGATLGCMEDLESTCMTYADGPGAEGEDGHWIPLGAAYWGLALTSTVDKGDGGASQEWPMTDSDCFFTDADGNVVGDGHNGGGPCATDAIPEGAQWMYLYPYLTPAVSMTVDVLV